jgi:hypothetical protein
MTDDPLKRNKLRKQREKKMERMKRLRERAKQKKKPDENGKQEIDERPKKKEEPEEDEDHYLEKHDPTELLKKREKYFQKEEMLKEKKEKEIERELLKLAEGVPMPLDQPRDEEIDPIFLEYKKMGTDFEGKGNEEFSEKEMKEYMNNLFLQKKQYLYMRDQEEDPKLENGNENEVDKRIQFLQDIHRKTIQIDDKKQKKRNEMEETKNENNGLGEEMEQKVTKAKILSSGHKKKEEVQNVTKIVNGNKTIISAKPSFSKEYLEFTAQRDDFIPVNVLKQKRKN